MQAMQTKTPKGGCCCINKKPEEAPKPETCRVCNVQFSENNFKFRNDSVSGSWQTKCNTCYNAEKYHKVHRERQLEQNPEEYRRHQAEMMQAWRLKNPEYMQALYQRHRADCEHRWKVLTASAAKRNIKVEKEAKQHIQQLMVLPCFYCAFVSHDGSLNGIDRVDSEAGYTCLNSVPCCAICNAMKARLTVDSFIHHVQRIAKHACKTIEVEASTRQLAPAFGGRTELRKSDKPKHCQLSEEQTIELWARECYLCGRQPALGIDRLDSFKDYTVDNVKSCCTRCNYMKKDLTPQAFCEHIVYLAIHTAYWVLSKDQYITHLGQQITPIAAYKNNHIEMVFPSVATAAHLSKTSTHMIAASGDSQQPCKGFSWRWHSAFDFVSQSIDYEHAVAFFSTIRQA